MKINKSQYNISEGNIVHCIPITPEECTNKKLELIPNEVIECFNEMIAENFNGHSATIKQKDICATIADRLYVSTTYVYSQKWLDIEDIYKKFGWKVEYDKPSYCDAHFIFTKG